MHFSLDPGYGVLSLDLIDDICRVSEGFDGVQIDFDPFRGTTRSIFSIS